MNTLDVLALAESEGVTVWADGGQLQLEADHQPTPELINLLRETKCDLLAHLIRQQAKVIDSRHHANDEPMLSKTHQRAIRGFHVILNEKRVNLRSNGYLPDSAVVTVDEWRNRIMRVIGLSYAEAEQIKHDLIQCGYLAYHSDLKTKLVEGDGNPLPDAENVLNDQCLHDGTGRGFSQWLYSDIAHGLG